MIPSTTNKLLVSEDWTKIYQSYRNSDFKSYDFETLRRTMITYLRENYPEDFNDYIDSSEYIALIDLIAYLGQNLSFRIDLNARENFLETAERRESVLRLARLINYNAKRNVPANGFLKIISVTTDDAVLDANGFNLANQVVTWNDPTNTNWYQQFVSILNSAMPGNFVFGRPYDKATISGIDHQQYRIDSLNTDVPIYGFNASINGTNMNFEVVPSTFANSSVVYEEPPRPADQFSFIYKNDNQGNGSSNTGFFVHFRQGAISLSTFKIDTAVPNDIIALNAPDINDTDVWLWQLTESGVYNTLWTKVTDLVGNNTIYNSINSDTRTIYSVLTRQNDAIDLNFSDGSFGDLPKGRFSLFYRQSNGLTYTIKPDQLSNIFITIPYSNKAGQTANLGITLSLQQTVSNSVGSETNAEIKAKAPQTYYVQNRMVTGEDYNIAPLVAGNDILKIKSINRLSSGISKYFELSDISGQYSKTNIYADDGILYKEYPTKNFEFNFVIESEILGVIKNILAPIVDSYEMRSFYFDKFPRVVAFETSFAWAQTQQTINQNKGYFVVDSQPVSVGAFSGNSLKYLSAGAMIRFVPPPGKYFLPNNKLTTTQSIDTKNYIWVKVVSIVGDGFNNGKGILDDGTGPIVLTGYVPSTAVIQEIIPKFANALSSGIESQIVNICYAKRNLGLRFDAEARQWTIITDSNLDLFSAFSLNFQGDTTNIGKDNSWLIAFEWTGRNYKVHYRTLDYIFESEQQTGFFVDEGKKNFDFVNDTVIKDQVNILSINSSPAKVTSISTTSYVEATSVITILQTTTSTNTFGSVLRFASTTPIVEQKYLAVHPSLKSSNGNFGYALVTQTGTTAIQVAGTATAIIATGTYITFIPEKIESTDNFVFSPVLSKETFSLGKDYPWQVDSAIIETDGYVNPNKVKVSFFDIDDDGQIDDIDAFNNIVLPLSTSTQTYSKDKFVFFKKQADGLRYKLATENILSFKTENEINVTPADGQLFYFYDADIDLIKGWNESEQIYEIQPDYYAYSGRKDLKFHYIHNSGNDRRIDPSKSNLIDIYLLTKSYDTEYRTWLVTRNGDEPLPPTSQSLEENFMPSLAPIKSISDEIVFQPTKYKVLFGNVANQALQGTFKAVRNSLKYASDNDIKTRIVLAIEDFFAIENWDFGKTFYFSELATYVMNRLTPDITNFVVVPKSVGSFGSLYEITCQGNEIFINGATVDDIEIIDSITASELKTASSVVTTSATGG
jgi:hypothetical protein